MVLSQPVSALYTPSTTCALVFKNQLCKLQFHDLLWDCTQDLRWKKKLLPPKAVTFSSTELLFSVCHSTFLSVLCKPLFRCKMDLNGTWSEHFENSYKWPLIQATDLGLTFCFSWCCCSYEEASLSLKTGFCLLAFFFEHVSSHFGIHYCLCCGLVGFFPPRRLQWFICKLQKLWIPILNCLLPVLSPE